MESITTKYTVTHDFDTRYVKNFVNEVSVLKSDIYFIKQERKINAKSIIGLLSLNLVNGDEIEIYASGNNMPVIADDYKKLIDILGE